MKTPQQIKNEVEKGCGIPLKESGEIEEDKDVYYPFTICGRKSNFDTLYCPSCLAKLSILTEYDKSIKEMIEEKRWVIRDDNRNIKINESIKVLFKLINGEIK